LLQVNYRPKLTSLYPKRVCRGSGCSQPSNDAMAAFSILKLLFCFRKPRVLNLSYIHVLIKNKPTLFVVWEIKNAWSVKLIPLKRSYNTAQKALIISIPAEQAQVTLKAANCWRRTKVNLTLCAVQLDEVATAQLISGFRPLNKVEVAAPLIAAIRSRAVIKPVSIQPRNAVIKQINRFPIHIHSLHYP